MAVTDGMTDFVQVINAFATGQIDRPEMDTAINRITGGDPSRTIRDMIVRAEVARAARAGAAPAAAESMASTAADIIRRYRAGELGPLGSPQARDAAIVEMSKVFKQDGRSQDSAFAAATAEFNRIIGQQTATAPRTPTKFIGPPSTPEMFSEQDFEEEQSATEAGRRNLYSRFMESRLPGGTPGATVRALGRQATPLSDIFNLGQGLGDIAPTASYSNFLRSRGVQGAPNPSVLQGLVGRARTLLGQVPKVGESENITGFREDLAADPNRQFQLAFRSQLPNVARPFQSAFGDVANRTFNRFELARGLGEQGGNFLDFENQAGLSGAGSPFDFQSGVRRAADLVSGPEAGLSGEQATFRNQLLEDPDEQFQLALQAALPSVSAPARAGFSEAAQRAFRRFQEQRGMFTPFLPHIAGNNFEFFR